jgi:hypothetical protein
MKNWGIVTGFLFVCASLPAQQLTWGHAIGGASADNLSRIAMDADHNVFTAGTYTAPAESIIGALPAYGFQDVMVCKYSPSGSLVWQIGIGGANTDLVSAIACNSEGDIWISGRFQGSIDLDPSDSSEIIGSDPTGSLDGYLAKYDGETGQLLDFRNITSGGTIDIRSIKIDAFDDIYIAGQYTNTVDFDFGGGSFSKTSNIFSGDCFVGRYYSDLQLVWMNVIGSQTPAIDFIGDMCLSADGYVYCTGLLGGTADINPGIGVTNLTAAVDAFLVKYSQNDGTLSWGFLLGGSSLDIGTSVIMTEDNQIVIAGSMNSTSMDVDPGVAQTVITKMGSNASPFLARYTNSAVLVSAVLMQGSQTLTATINRISLGQTNSILITGSYKGDVDIELGDSSFNISSGDSANSYILRCASDWSLIQYFEQGGNGDQTGYDLIAEGTNVFLVGQMSNTLYPEFPAATNLIPRNGNGLDGFVLKYNFVPDALSLNDKQNKNFQVFPNPTSGLITIGNNDIKSCSIIDVTGRIQKLEVLNNQIDIERFPSGIYTLILESQSGICFKRIIRN